MKIQMLVYPGMTPLDLIGPAQAWARLPDVEMQYVWKAPGPIATDAGLSVVATTSFSSAWETPDILFVPGGEGPTFDLLEDVETIQFLGSRGRVSGWVTSVCTGSLLLGAAGLLTGYRTTSHWLLRAELARFGATPTADRWVIDRNRATGGGVTAGIDFGLMLVGLLAGEPRARVVQLMMEYAPKPPFRSGSPEEALPETLALVRNGWAGTSEKRVRAQIDRAAEQLALLS